MKIQHLLLASVIVALNFGATHTSFGQILEYNFNQTGVTAPSTGSNSSALTFRSSAGTDTDLHSVAGGGVSGIPGDRSFNNTASTGMGNAGTGGYGRTTSDLSGSFNGAVSITLQGWFKSGTVVGSGAQLINYTSGSNGFQLSAPNTGNLSLAVNGTNAFGTGTAFNTTDAWTFFAVTYDSSLASNNAKFYVGSLSGAVTLAYQVTLTAGAVTAPGSSIGLYVGNNLNVNRPYDGFLDDIRIYGSTTGSSGALNLSQLEAIRALDAVPEPATQGLIALGAAILFFAIRRKSQKLTSVG